VWTWQPSRPQASDPGHAHETTNPNHSGWRIVNILGGVVSGKARAAFQQRGPELRNLLSIPVRAECNADVLRHERNSHQLHFQSVICHELHVITQTTITTMNSKPQCTCSSAPKLIFPCSGASDVGGLADRAARQMTLDQTGKMYCLAGIGGRVRTIMETTRDAVKILVIDGCPQECARKTVEQAGFNGFQHLTLFSLGLHKGSGPATDENIRRVTTQGAELLA
jgi:uncharacterized metal-binding protein